MRLTVDMIVESNVSEKSVSGNAWVLSVSCNRTNVQYQEMKTVPETRHFCKTARCPSSETLWRYRRRRLSIVERITIERHLHDCDFCSAETQLLNRYRPEAEVAEFVKMPSHLQKLAVSLFSKNSELSQMGQLMVRRPLSH
jgi:hypothetical protein